MKLTRDFKQLNKNNADLAGGKGASLGEMTQAGIPVPPGFVVLSESFEQFIQETDLVQEIDAILDKVDHKAIHTVEAASESIRALILSREMPKDISDEILRSFKELDTKYVAVRSSATAEDGMDHAWAGQLESYLNTTEEDLLTKVKLCWSSLFTPRAIFYRFEKGLHTTKISVAVVVQKMVESEVSGIAFSVHPVTEDRNQLIIEAGFGLGEAIVSGSVTPDSYVVEKEPRNILDINISTQNKGLYRSENNTKEHGNNEWKDIPEPKASSQVLTKEQILELSEIILKIENHYGFPCDIEWAFEEGKFYIVQSRPITTLLVGSENNIASLKSNFSKFSSIASKRTWRKDWEGTFSILLSNMSTIPYFKNFKEEFGVNIENTITTHKNGLASCFISIEDEKKFGDEMSKRVLNNPNLLNEWSNRTKKEYDNVFSLINLETVEVLTKENLSKLIGYVQQFTAYLGAIKYVSNFLEKSFIDKYGQSIFEARTYTEKIFPSLEILANNISKYIGKKEGYNPELIPAMTTDELVKYVDTQELPEQSTLEQRKKLSAYLYQDTISEIVGNEVLQIEKIIYGENTDILYGTGVYPGKVTGKVKIILEFGKQHAKFEEGDILVSGMTDPNFVPLMKKAKAIITDGGGVLCHAAIVSRELGVPCVIGTGKATQVLKDGDEVEVDADTGIIRILNTYTEDQDPKTLFGIVRDDYEGLGQWVSPVLEFELWMDWSITDDALKLGFPKDPYPWVSVDGHFFKRKNDAYVFIREKVYSEFKNNTYDFTKLILSKAEELSLVCIKAANSIKGPLTFEEFKKYFEIMHRLRFPWMSFFAVDQGSSQYLKEYAEVHNLKVDDIVASIPQLPNTLTEDQKKLVEFKKKIDAAGLECDIEKIRAVDKVLAEEILTYQKNTEYVGTHHMWGDPRTIDRLLSAISHAHESYEAQVQEISEYPFVPVLSEMSKWRLECAQSSARLAYALRPTLAVFAEKVGISYDDIIQLTTKEIKSLLDGDPKDFSFIKDRQDKFAIFRLENDITVLTGKEYDQVASFFGLDEKFENTETIKGSIGNKGKVRGIVAIVRKPQDNKKLEKGMILVAPETTPDFIPAMGMAAAFVTDFGGITSHAAIVAREMNKPCIIGTKIATKILKDGDMVEVDADNGVVKILNK